MGHPVGLYICITMDSGVVANEIRNSDLTKYLQKHIKKNVQYTKLMIKVVNVALQYDHVLLHLS